MASSSGTTSSGSSLLQNSGSEEDLQALMDQRKRKRMISNRESAKRSRMRKQKHLDDLTTQMVQMRKENHLIVTNLNITTQHYVAIEAENSVLKAQVDELSHRLESLNEIICFLNASSSCNNSNNSKNNNGIYGGASSSSAGAGAGGDHGGVGGSDLIINNLLMMKSCESDDYCCDGFFNNPLQMPLYLNQPLMASADMFQDY